MQPPPKACYISKVRVRAFKCVGDWLEVELQPGLNAIVGENGAGKSTLLEAVMFACAVPVSMLNVPTQADLKNSNSREVCTVELELSTVSSRAPAFSKPAHRLAASLSPDGKRTYRLDGRAATGKQVQSQLRAVGISLEANTSVMRQASVTQLADANSPAALAAVVADASGAGVWKKAAAQAAAEREEHERHALLCQADLQTIANLNGNVQAAARAAQRAEELQHGADAAAQRLGEALAAAAAQGEAERAAAALLQADQECEVERLRAEKERCGEEAEEAEAAAAEQRRALCAGPAGAALHQREAALQEEVSLLRANLEEHASLEGRCAAAQEAQRRARDAHALAAASLAAAGRAQARADADAHAAASCNAAAGIRRQLQKDVRQLVAEAPGAQRASEEAQRALRSARASQQAAATAHASAKTRATRCAEQLAAATLDSPPSPQSVAQQHGQLARLRAQEAQLRRELAAAAARLPAAPAPWLAPLHACFSFRDPAACEELATALEVAVGGQLGVMVAPTRDRVAQELQRGGGNGNGNGALAAGARVWPLDALLQGDDAREARHRRAAASFPAGRVVLPLDLVQSGEGCGAAVGRALGALVVAADARTADALLHAHGVPSVALDGTVVRKGSITGGWRPEGGARSRGGLVRAKLRADGVRARLAAVEAEARQLAAAVQAGELAAAQAEERQQAAASAAEEEESAAQALAATAAELEAAAAGGAAAAARVQRAQAALQAKRAMLEGVAGEEGDGALVHALQHDALRHAEAAQESRRQEGALRREAAAAAETALALSHRLDISAPRVPDWRSALESSQTALLEARARMAEHRSASAAAQQAADAAGRAVVERRRHLGDLQGALEEAEQAAAAAADEVQRAEEALAAACQRERELAREVPALALRARRGGGAPTAAPPGDLACASLAGALEAADALAAEYKDLQAQARRCRARAAHLPPGAASAPDVAEGLRANMAAVAIGEAALQRGVEAWAPAVVAHNERCFDAVAAAFPRLAGCGLRGVEVEVCRVGGEVHVDGARFRHRLVARGGGAGPWAEGLRALSGGQRSVASLAFMAAAGAQRTGGAGGGVLLCDEVDAALDAANQGLAAGMLRALCTRGGGGGGGGGAACAQVVCVSHNPEFQAHCGHVVKLGRGEDGATAVVAGGGGRGGAGREGRGGGAGGRAR